MPSSYTILGIFDSEYGNVIYAYGFLGFLLIILFYIRCFRLTEKRDRIFYVILLWCISSTVLFSFRMSFVFLMLLSHVVSLGRAQEK